MNRCKSKKGSLRHKSGDRRHRRPETSVKVLDFNLPLKSWKWKYVLWRLVTWYMSCKLLLPWFWEKGFMHLAPRDIYIYIYCYKRSWGASGRLLSGNCSWLHSCICISILSKLAQSFRCFDVSTPCFMWCRSQKCAMWSVWWKFHRFKSKRPWFFPTSKLVIPFHPWRYTWHHPMNSNWWAKNQPGSNSKETPSKRQVVRTVPRLEVQEVIREVPKLEAPAKDPNIW